MPRLPMGLYEKLITEELAQELAALAEHLEAREGPVDPDAAPQVLAGFLHDVVLRALRSIRGDECLSDRVALANEVLRTLLRQAPASGLLGSDAVATPARQLLSVADKTPGTLAESAPPPRPRIPLRSSDLLINGPRDLRIGAEIQRELCSADRVDLLVSFLKWSGVRVIEDALGAFCRRCPAKLRVLTTAYLGATEPKALDRLRALGAQIRVSYDNRRTRLHAKAWLFHRESGFSTAFIGSSNLSAPAILDGLEWNVRLSEVDNHAILAKFRSAFEQYWEEGEFIDYDAEAFREAIGKERDNSALIASIDVRPFAHQQQILDDLQTERDRGHCRNLVVAATGTGKTIVAALDYRQLCKEQGDLSLLFVAHRREILEQARHMFRVVLQDGSFGELLVAGRRPDEGHHVFAAIQSLHQDRLGSVSSQAYDVVIVDEFHHAAAPTYERLLSQLQPRYLLGLTATPERADGLSVLRWFDDRIAAELRLWTALDRGLLVPFQYFGVSDETDLRHLTWKRGGYASEELENVYTGDDVRVSIVLRALRDKVRDLDSLKAIGFCVSIRHAEFMARRFRDAGVRALAVHGETPAEQRATALRELKQGNLSVLFTVDLFNEGIDVPDVNTILFLRPTESATVFLQQLGRGLRHADGKACLTVLDFIGNAHRQFRFDVRYRAIVGGTRQRVAEEIEQGFPYLPPGCSMHLDRQAQEVVLANVRRALELGWRGLVDDLQGLGDVSLTTFLNRAGVGLDELYRGGRCWSDLRRAANLPTPPAGPDESHLARALGRLIHVDDPDRLDAWRVWLSNAKPPAVAPLGSRENRLQRMLFVGLGHVRRPLAELPAAFGELWRHPAIRSELLELLDVLDSRIRRRTAPIDETPEVPLRTHATYSLDEIMAAYGVERHGRIYRPRGQGVWYEPSVNTDLLFVTLEKTEAEYSPTTLYEDYPMSPTEFHWESQNNTSSSSPVGRRYVDGASRVMLFVRQRRKDDRNITSPYVLLGRVRYVRHEHERPMRIVWRLDRAMPTGWYSEVKLAAG